MAPWRRGISENVLDRNEIRLLIKTGRRVEAITADCIDHKEIILLVNTAG